MAKSSRAKVEAGKKGSSKVAKAKDSPFPTNVKAVDPTLASLFASSAGPVKAPARARYELPEPRPRNGAQKDGTTSSEESEDDASQEHGSGEESDEGGNDTASTSESDASDDESELGPPALAAPEEPLSRKRKRKGREEAVEDRYMSRIVDEEAKEDRKRKEERAKKRHKGSGAEDDEASDLDTATPRHEQAADDADIPQHESLATTKGADEVEKSTRTVFLANVSTSAITSKSAKKKLTDHLVSVLPSLGEPAAGGATHKLESLRFRSTAFSSNNIPRKAAFARQELMDATTKSTNAYAVYSTAVAAREAAKKLNGTMVLDRHLRVDSVAHPAQTDHRRCVFVGNLGFVDDETAMDANDPNGTRKKSSKPPGDVEEGLWRQFSIAGTLESVRVVRDPKTRVGKGFAYVQFKDANAVEKALLYNEKRFPPLLPRKMRVIRAKHISTKGSVSSARPANRATPTGNPNKIYVPKPSSEAQSFQGRAGKLLGRAGAAKVRTGGQDPGSNGKSVNGFKSPESIVFEGYRASSKTGKAGLKLGGSGKKKGKPRTRSSVRGSAWKASGGKK